MRNNHEQTGIRARFVRLFEQTPLFAPSLMMRLADYPAQMRRIPSCARFWAELTRRYPGELPRFAVGPRDTSGLDRWLQSHGYHREMSETVLVLNREAFHNVGSASNFVHEVADVDDLRRVLALDHLVFHDPNSRPGWHGPGTGTLGIAPSPLLHAE